MHRLLRHFYGGDQHSHHRDQHSHGEATPRTTGNVIHWAKHYDLVAQIMTLGRAGQVRRKSIEAAYIAPGECVLDVGCGTGDLALLAKERTGSTGQVSGLDASPEMIDVARRKAARRHADVDFRLGVIERLPYPDAAFDVVLSSLMMHHLPADLKPLALAEIQRALKPNGRLLIIDFKGMLEQQGVARLLQQAGFVQVEQGVVWSKQLGFVRARKA
jgi:demethylmenaquinone methyltransferase/2-methoxy-6-polyprenyl-1,4-benzoquinol methylase/phosphoethanolamine N-methyltransferase